jgi:hypothetical protein
MRRSTLSLLAASVLLVGLAVSLSTEGRPPVGDEATYLLAAESLWHDHDLRWDRRDLDRAFRQWPNGPRGLALVPAGPGGGTPAFGRPLLYPLVAAPFYGVLGPRGLPVLGMLLFMAMAWAARRRLALPRAGPRPGSEAPARRAGSQILVAGFFFASAAFAWAFRFQPEVLLMACAFFSVALWCRVRTSPAWGRRELAPLAAAGALLAAAASYQPSLALLALPIAVDLLRARRLKAVGVFAVALVAAGVLLAGAQRHLTGGLTSGWGPSLERSARTYRDTFPGEIATGGTPRAQAPPDRLEPAPASAHSPGLLLRDAGYFLVGRHVGLLPYFSFAFFVLGLYLTDLRGPGGRSRHLLAAALAVYCALIVWNLPAAAAPGAAGPAVPGDRAFALVYPVLLFLPRRLRAGRLVLLAFAAAGLWTAPALLASIQGASPDYTLELHARGASYRPLPLELTLLADGRLPGYRRTAVWAGGDGATWLVPRENFYLDEGNPRGAWVRGASRSEVFVVSPEPLETIRLEVQSLAARNTLLLRGRGPALRVRFDSAGKRLGTPVEIRPEPLGVVRGLFNPGPTAESAPEYLYRFVLRSSGGAVPARLDPKSHDPRYLGVFLVARAPAG